MTESSQMADDLRFVRKTVEARNRSRPPGAAHLVIWALYSLICLPTYDYIPSQGGKINLIGWLVAAVLSGIFGKRGALRSGEVDHATIKRTLLHWYGGVVLMLVAIYGLAWANPGISPEAFGQISVILVGFLYFTAGVHFPDARFMRWAGPVIVVAGIGVGLLPHYRWTVMGLIFAACLMSPLVFGRRTNTATEQP